jgi:hypothetical protein
MQELSVLGTMEGTDRMPRTQAAAGDEPMKRLVVSISDNLHHRIRVIAAERRLTMTEVIREALEREVARQRENAA